MTKTKHLYSLIKTPEHRSDRARAEHSPIAEQGSMFASEARHGQDRNVSKAWPAWKDRLTAVLMHLEEDQVLVISTKRGNHYVQFSAQGAFGMRAETTSNEYLEEPEMLSASQVQALLSAGWNSPTGDSSTATPDLDPDGSPNFFVDFDVPVAYLGVADLTVRTFSMILGVPHPGWLQYEAFDADGKSLDFQHLGLKRAGLPPELGQQDTRSQQLLQAIRETTRIPDLSYRSDGKIEVGFGSATVYASWLDCMTGVRYLSPVLQQVEDQPGLLERLNQLNASCPLARFYYSNKTIFASADIAAVPFSQEKVSQTFRYFSQLAHNLDGLLQKEFGGLMSCGPPPSDVVTH